MHRFHLPTDKWDGATLSADESHHCTHVLRLKEGDKITVFDGKGREAQAIIASTASDKVSVKIGASTKTSPPPCEITLAQAVPKGKNMDLIVQKAVELGATRIAPILSDRTIVQLEAGETSKKQAKWQEVALEACKQCGQNYIPEVEAPLSPREFLERADKNQLLLIASLQPDARPLKTVLEEYSSQAGALPRRITVFVGPEGDFTPAEIALAKSHGCQPITLGPIILRTETAAIYCLSVLGHELFTPPQAGR